VPNFNNMGLVRSAVLSDNGRTSTRKSGTDYSSGEAPFQHDSNKGVTSGPNLNKGVASEPNRNTGAALQHHVWGEKEAGVAPRYEYLEQTTVMSRGVGGVFPNDAAKRPLENGRKPSRNEGEGPTHYGGGGDTSRHGRGEADSGASFYDNADSEPQLYCQNLPEFKSVLDVFTIVDVFLTLLIPIVVIVALVVPTCVKNITCGPRGATSASVVLSRKERALLRVTRLLCVIIVSFVVLTVPSNIIKLREVSAHFDFPFDFASQRCKSNYVQCPV
jgi:hypothetical protein